MAKLICTETLRLKKIRHSGIVAGLKGRSSDQCPWQDHSKRCAWIEGWREGHENYQSGSFWIH